MTGAHEVVGVTIMVLGLALLLVTALVDLPGRRPQTRSTAKLAAACYAASFAALLGGAWLRAG